MNFSLAPGTYVIGVSGGVDSMVLLHMLQSQPSMELVVAHFDHQMRSDSSQDAALVAAVAKKYNLRFVTATGDLGPKASEATARAARYAFLRSVQAEFSAQAILTAHHQDDVLETAIINWSRGTGWRGLTSLSSDDGLLRPLLAMSKQAILRYAKLNDLLWREDSTNSDTRYLRNYIRHELLPKWTEKDRNNLIECLTKLQLTKRELNNELDKAVIVLSQGTLINRVALTKLPVPLIRELLITWWRQNNFYAYQSKTITRAIITICQGNTRDIIPLKGNLQMVLGREALALQICER